MPAEVPLVAVALTWRDAPSAVRARAASPVGRARFDGLRAHGVDGLVELHTCARSVWLVAARNGAWAGALLQSDVAARTGVETLPAVWAGVDAARYALRVAVGLDSYVQGERDVGNQLLAAFDAAREAGQGALALNLLQQSAARLLAEGREQGFVRPNRGLGSLAVAALSDRGVDLSVPVAVIGAGAIGRRVVCALARAGAAPPIVYNRTVRPDTRPLDAIGRGEHVAAVLCTAGPARWFRPPPGLGWLVDLGVPEQVAPGPGVLGLDALLGGDPLRLPEARVRAAEDAVEREIDAFRARLHAPLRRRSLAGANRLRDRFLEEELDDHLARALDGLPEEQRRRVRLAARGALRQYNHRVLTWIKQELG